MPKKIPMRMCVGCRTMKPKRELLRVVRTPEDAVVLDFTGKKNGRGAYLCHSEDCLKRAGKQKQLDRALERPVSPEVLALLGEEIRRTPKAEIIDAG